MSLISRRRRVMVAHDARPATAGSSVDVCPRPAWRAIEPGVGPDHAVAGVLVLAEVDEEPELLGARDGQGELDRRGVGAEVGVGVDLLAVGEDPAVDPALALEASSKPTRASKVAYRPLRS